MKRHEGEPDVDEALVRRLLDDQLPHLADRPLRLVEQQGTDHTLYRLGDDLVVRMPGNPHSPGQALREARWLPFLVPQVPFELPEPIALGEPDHGYPWTWSVVRWIDGERYEPDGTGDEQAATDLAAFGRALRACDATDGPPAGVETWGRGAPLAPWAERLEPWIARLREAGWERLDAALGVLHDALDAPPWDGPPMWFHGDLSFNLIARHSRLVGAIDSPYGVGDPACDLMPGWMLFHGEARRRFFDESELDDDAVTRARGWAVAPSLVGLTYYEHVPHLHADARRSIEAALSP